MAWRPTKYHARKTIIDGETFDSHLEGTVYLKLKEWEKAGLIKDLRRQVKFVLIPTIREPDIVGPKGGIHKGKVIEKEVAYYADFAFDVVTDEIYGYEPGFTVVDVKGVKTTDYILKRKMMLYLLGIRIKEV